MSWGGYSVASCMLAATWLAAAAQAGAQGLPDLIIDGTNVAPRVVFRTFAVDACEVAEGCSEPGQRTLLTFRTEAWNIGAADVVLGDPASNPLFHYHDCHQHYHFEQFSEYRLVDAGGGTILGRKNSFCLLDSKRIDPAAPPDPVYHCDYQGIQAGWGDVYGRNLPCQWIDITNVPPGSYTLELEVDPDGLLGDADYSNNVTTVPVEISAADLFTPTPTRTPTVTPTPNPCGATLSLVGKANVNTGTTGNTLSVAVGSASVAAGNTILVAFTMDQSPGPVTCSDSAGNVYGIASDQNNGTDLRGVVCAAYDVAALASGASITVTHPTTSNSRNVSVAKVAGLIAAPLDQQAGATGSGTLPSSGNTAPTTQAIELIYGVVGHRGYTSNFTPGAGLKLLGAVGSTGTTNRATEPLYQFVSAVGTYAVSGTLNPARNWAANVLTLKCPDAMAPATRTPTPSATGMAPASATATPSRTSTLPPSATPTAAATPTSAPSGCAATISLVGTAGVDTGTQGTALSVTVGGAGIPAGNAVLVAFTMDDTTGPVGCADTGGNLYQVEIDRRYFSNLRIVICAAYNVGALASGASITLTHPSTSTSRNLSIARVTGLLPLPLDQKISAVGTGTTASSGNMPQTAQAAELVYGVIGHRAIASNFTPGSGLTLLGAVGSSGTLNRSTEPLYRFVSATGSYAVNGTLSTTRDWAAGALTLRCQ